MIENKPERNLYVYHTLSDSPVGKTLQQCVKGALFHVPFLAQPLMRPYINILLTCCSFLIFSSYYSIAPFLSASSKALAWFTHYTQNTVWQSSAWSPVPSVMSSHQRHASVSRSPNPPPPNQSAYVCLKAANHNLHTPAFKYEWHQCISELLIGSHVIVPEFFQAWISLKFELY